MLLRCHSNQVVADCRDVLFLPRGYDIQLDADCYAALRLPREKVEDGRDGYVEVGLDSCLPVANGLIVLPLNHDRRLRRSRYIVSADVLMPTFLDVCMSRAVVLRHMYSSAAA